MLWSNLAFTISQFLVSQFFMDRGPGYSTSSSFMLEYGVNVLVTLAALQSNVECYTANRRNTGRRSTWRTKKKQAPDTSEADIGRMQDK